MNTYWYQCNNLLLSSAIEDDWRVATSPRVVLLRILEQMDQLYNLEYQVSILRLPASISRIGTATTVILSSRPGISLPPFCDESNHLRHVADDVSLKVHVADDVNLKVARLCTSLGLM